MQIIVEKVEDVRAGYIKVASANARLALEITLSTSRSRENQGVRRESATHSLQPTALVHEAYLRLVNIAKLEWEDRAHFFVSLPP